MKRSFLVVALAFVAAIVLAVPASALTTWNLTNSNTDPLELLSPNIGTPTLLGTSQGFTSTDSLSALTASGHSLNTGGLENLNQNIRGLGVTGGGLAFCGAFGLDQCGPAEYIQFDFANANWTPISVTLTMLNSGDNYKIWGDVDGNLLTTGDNVLLASGMGGSDPLTIALSSGPSQHLYVSTVIEADCTSTLHCGSSANDIFRVSQVQGEVPEPGTLLLFGTGLVTIAGVARRRHK